MKTAPYYNKEFLLPTPKPIWNKIFYDTYFSFDIKKYRSIITDKKFQSIIKSKIIEYVTKNNNIYGLENFNYNYLTNGCTGFINNCYQSNKIQVLHGEYSYHQKLGNNSVGLLELKNNIPLIISIPNTCTSSLPNNWNDISQICSERNIDIYIDACWLGCSEQLTLDLSHCQIKQIGFSLSKSFDMMNNRIGVILSKNDLTNTSIGIMNAYDMIDKTNSAMALHYIETLGDNFLWNYYREEYEKLCFDFNLTKTNCIHSAIFENKLIGTRALLTYLKK
jgi:hypothetical protein